MVSRLGRAHNQGKKARPSRKKITLDGHFTPTHNRLQGLHSARIFSSDHVLKTLYVQAIRVSVCDVDLCTTRILTVCGLCCRARLFSTIRPVSPMMQLRQQQQQLSQQVVSPTSFTPVSAPLVSSIVQTLLGRRWKSRGNNYQPNTYKRKRTLGFMSRMRSKTGRKIVERRKAKGRWYLAH